VSYKGPAQGSPPSLRALPVPEVVINGVLHGGRADGELVRVCAATGVRDA
jgi:hypothetical protein